LVTCHHVVSSSDSKVNVVFISNSRHGMPLGGGGVPWYGDIAFTLPTAEMSHRTYKLLITIISIVEHFYKE